MDERSYNISMMQPTEDPADVNKLINDPSIKPWVCGPITGYLDITVLMDDKNVFFAEDLGGVGFIFKDEKTYECHTFVLPEGRGKWARERFFQTLEWMFKHTEAEKIVTMCPVNNRMSIGAARMAGFKKYSTIPNSWVYEGKMYDMDAYVYFKEQHRCQ